MQIVADRLWLCRHMLAALGISLQCLGLMSGQLLGADRAIDFNRDIRPILSNNCSKCHGFDEKERQGNLRLDTKEGLTAVAESGLPAIVPGKSGESELLRRILTADENEKMPPPASGKVVTPEQAELLEQWIDQGAEWKGHWSFIKPDRHEPPATKHEALAANPIDRFVLAELDRKGLNPSPVAEKATLLRRVTLDLTGLPPSLSEIDAFVADQSPDAYEKVVDRLLKSPRYGEHFARYWLDAVRYGDTHGLHLDNERALWLYRDWVINAFNENKPFNQFTIEQLAGDLLPNATLDQRIATGFNRCNVTTGEGGSIDEEVLVRYNVDRVDALGTIFLGLTTGCAVCHNHKFDPITQKEFYQLYAFFNGIAENAMDGNVLAPPPLLKAPTPENNAREQQLNQQLADAKTKIAEALAKFEYVDPTPAVAEVKPVTEPQEYVWVDDAVPPGANAQGSTPWQFVEKKDFAVYSGEKASTRTGEGITQHFFTDANPMLKIGEGDKLFAYCYIDEKNPPKTVMLQWNDGSWEHRAYWGEDAIAFGAGDTAGHRQMGPLPEPGKWVRLEVDAAHVGLPAGSNVNGWAFTQFGGTVYWDKAGSVTKTPQVAQNFVSLAAWEQYEKGLEKSAIPQPVQQAIKADLDKRTPEQTQAIREYFLEHVYGKSREEIAPLRKQIEDLTKQKTAFDSTIPTTMVAAEMAKARDTFLLVRGQYDKKGDQVTPAVPAVLPPLPEGAPANRLGLAQWLVDPNHPLTARVTVNRYWQQYFGRGLVKTSEDFGTQGDWPSHPELLDWLATEFIRTNWDVKAMQKLIVMSHTYRQASQVSPELLAKDPENQLLARGPRFRMDAEMVRDSALASSGLLVEQLGGRSVKPYQPEGIWEAVGFVGSNTREFKQENGNALYRRSLYTFWKRTAPPPSLVTFDAPSRENCTVRRARTNTPLQALVLMNDKQYVEAARQLAQKMVLEGGATLEERATYGFRLATGRQPTAAESAVLLKFFAIQLGEYLAQPESAGKLLEIGETKRLESIGAPELAAWTMVANVILNLDEAVTKE